MDITRRRLLQAGFAMASSLPLPIVYAQGYPAQPIRLIVPFPPGGSADVIARGIAQRMSALLGQSVLVENRAGAGGNIGGELVVRAAPDGYTLLFATIVLVINPHLYTSMGFDPLKDLQPIAQVASAQQLLLVNPAVPARTVAELIALARARPGSIAFGSAGNGTAGHLAVEILRAQTGVDVLHVPYKGAAPAMTDLLSGQLQAMFETATTALPQLRAGKVRAIAVAGPTRSALLPELPTVSDTVPGLAYTAWYGLAAPAGTPRTIVERLQSVAAEASQNSDLKQRFADIGTEVSTTSAAEFQALWRRETAMWGDAVRRSGAKIE